MVLYVAIRQQIAETILSTVELQTLLRRSFSCDVEMILFQCLSNLICLDTLTSDAIKSERFV